MIIQNMYSFSLKQSRGCKMLTVPAHETCSTSVVSITSDVLNHNWQNHRLASYCTYGPVATPR